MAGDLKSLPCNGRPGALVGSVSGVVALPILNDEAVRTDHKAEPNTALLFSSDAGRNHDGYTYN